MIVPVPAVVVSVERVHKAIDNACDQTNSRLLADDSSHKNSNNTKSVIFRRGTLDDISGLITILKDAQINRDQLVRDFDLVHWIILEKCNQVLGLAAFYWAYSTWDGRVLYVNKVTAPNTELETSLLYTLADIAVQLEGQRLVWQHRHDKSSLYNSMGAQTLDSWLTLRMTTDGMDRFLSSQVTEKELVNSIAGAETADRSSVYESIKIALKAVQSDTAELHLATDSDLHHIERLVHSLAVYENEVEAIHINKEHYGKDGFGVQTPLYQCILVWDKDDEHYCGMAFFYFGYDVNKGRFLYLEDLYIEDRYRGTRRGTLVMATLASIAKNVGCEGFVWQALDWNTPALKFYEKIGATVLDGLLTTRFCGESLKDFVRNRPTTKF